MKNLMIVMLLVSGAVMAEEWKLNLTRKDSNLYKINYIGGYNNEWFVKTKYCYEHTYSQDVYARWEPGRWDNFIQFDSRTKCDIESIQNVITYR